MTSLLKWVTLVRSNSQIGDMASEVLLSWSWLVTILLILATICMAFKTLIGDTLQFWRCGGRAFIQELLARFHAIHLLKAPSLSKAIQIGTSTCKSWCDHHKCFLSTGCSLLVVAQS
uniref:Uncharacterized protein n=1 Tax=Physcomitrium patens TaxID=3218 RepID=A0A2K1KF47_PHYPA|nr:hypothetical protein PHYPA_008772 [Physcomitrium patens]